MSVMLTEFLLARIAEDEAVARGTAAGVRVVADRRPTFGHPDANSALPAVSLPASRVLAETKAKRAILKAHRNDFGSCASCATDWQDEDVDGNPAGGAWSESFPCPTVRHLAAVYANHPDYDEAWRA